MFVYSIFSRLIGIYISQSFINMAICKESSYTASCINSYPMGNSDMMKSIPNFKPNLNAATVYIYMLEKLS